MSDFQVGKEYPPFIIKNRRTGMFVATAIAPRSANYRMPCARWKWVRTEQEAEKFHDRMMLIHPIIQMDIERNAVCLDRRGNEVKP